LSFGGLELSSGGAPTRTLIRPGEQLTPLPRRRGLFAPARQHQKQEMESWDHLVDTNVENSELEADADDFQVGSIPIQQSIGESSAPVKGNKKRSKNFSEKEDVLLVSAWLEISVDPVQSIDQTRATYWQRIHDYYHEHKDFTSYPWHHVLFCVIYLYRDLCQFYGVLFYSCRLYMMYG
ncbi:unnamed protein product, partial [Urochloa humidicola]